MEKEVEFYNSLEIQIDKISDLVSQLKEENRRLEEHNEQLTIQIQSVNNTNQTEAIAEVQDNIQKKELTLTQYEFLRNSINNALVKLNHLRQAVTEAS